MDRRRFLNALTLGAAALAIDPERLLWAPTKTIFVPKPVAGLAFHRNAFCLSVAELSLPAPKLATTFWLDGDGVLWAIDETSVRASTAHFPPFV